MRNYYKLLFLILTTSVVFAQSPPQTNLKLHLRADTNVTADLGTKAVSSWEDTRNNGLVATQSTVANQPHLVASTSGINNHETISFDGTDDYLILPTPSAIGCAPYKNYDIYIVARSFSSNIQFLIAGGAVEVYEIHLNGPGARYISKTVNGITYLVDNGNQGDFTDGEAHVFAGRTTANGSYMRVDGNDGAKKLQTLYAQDNTNLRLGRRSDGTFALLGEIAEVLIYANSGGNGESMTAQDRTSLETYLATRYNITSGSMPVELSAFTANVNENKVILKWQTATEVNNYGFEIERQTVAQISNLSSEWEKVGFVEGHGNSNSPKDYSFTDTNPSRSNVKYRLKQIDFDGKFEYSNEIEVFVEIPANFVLEQNHPNPFNPSTEIGFSLPQNRNVKITVYNSIGQKVATLINSELQAGNHKVNFDASKLTSGIYFYTMESGNFVQTKKLLLMK